MADRNLIAKRADTLTQVVSLIAHAGPLTISETISRTTSGIIRDTLTRTIDSIPRWPRCPIHRTQVFDPRYFGSIAHEVLSAFIAFGNSFLGCQAYSQAHKAFGRKYYTCISVTFGLMMMSYLGRVAERWRRASYSFISLRATRTPLGYSPSRRFTVGCLPFHVIRRA